MTATLRLPICLGIQLRWLALGADYRVDKVINKAGCQVIWLSHSDIDKSLVLTVDVNDVSG